MQTKDLDALLKVLRKHRVTSYPTEHGPILLTGYASEASEVSRKKRPGPGEDAQAADVGFELPELDENDGDPRTLLEDLAKANSAAYAAQAAAGIAGARGKQ